MKNLSPYILSLLLLASCTGKRGGDGKADGDSIQESATETFADLPLPAIPQSLVSPGARAAYLSLHFWDAMDFSNHALSLDTAFMEQNFANYLSVLPAVAQESERSESVGALLRKAARDSTASAFLSEVVEKYLRDPNSPMRDEELLMVFYEQMLQMSNIPEWDKERIAWKLRMAKKNRPGMVGADFAFVDRVGKRRRLSNEVKGTEYTLLLFYDYDCETCAGVEKDMMEDPALASATASGLLHIVAVNVFGNDLPEWKRQSASFPEGWTVGYSPGCEVVEHDIYGINAAPTLYLFDSERRVILKDVSLQDVSSALLSLHPQN